MVGRPEMKPRQGSLRRSRGDTRLRGSVAALAAIEPGPRHWAGETPNCLVLTGDMPVNSEPGFHLASPGA